MSVTLKALFVSKTILIQLNADAIGDVVPEMAIPRFANGQNFLNREMLVINVEKY